MTPDIIEECARRLCREDGWNDPDLVLAINDGPPGRPVADIAVPVWTRYVAKARAMIDASSMAGEGK